MNSPIHLFRYIILLITVWIGEISLYGQPSALPSWLRGERETEDVLSIFSVSDSNSDEKSGQEEAIFRSAAFHALLGRSLYSRKIDVYNERFEGKQGKRMVKTMVALYADFDTVGIKVTDSFQNSYGETFVNSLRPDSCLKKRYQVELFLFRESTTNYLRGGRIDWKIKEISTGRILYFLSVYSSGASFEVFNQYCLPGETLNQVARNRYPSVENRMIKNGVIFEGLPVSLSHGLFQGALRAFAEAAFCAFDQSMQIRQQQTHSNLGTQKLIDTQTIESISIQIPRVMIRDNKISLSVHFTSLNRGYD